MGEDRKRAGFTHIWHTYQREALIFVKGAQSVVLLVEAGMQTMSQMRFDLFRKDFFEDDGSDCIGVVSSASVSDTISQQTVGEPGGEF